MHAAHVRKGRQEYRKQESERALIAFRSYRALAVPTALIAWFGGEEWRCGFPGGANVVSEHPRNAPMTWAHLGG